MDFIKCERCGIPLNRETVSVKNPKICWECAEEKRRFTPEPSSISAFGGPMEMPIPSAKSMGK
ncbi:MAG: hypothetical protein G01um101418_405 [Parcubacteria group bacterium Gr01-1014_18]|nr:MAG: hypothetical protein Greene041636_349 [Parcubacteria group bacterium Greene0416_36]TSC81126.1 MAG: hypothetical protein G01um101418_405 [Parcubacteria group bacterium Gr01-1014_18]TSC98457.1 MAG: hypothetical protein Greene101420_694 [Parcubacteria group bacterium Greene1014_20]TSD07377.1 MAG: hypothetical protein Greene07142_232 [Parcubacteria group bacterium Greene0714_2]